MLAALVALSAAAPSSAEDAPEAPAPKAAAQITGKVRFVGKIEPPAELVAHHDMEVCKKGGPLIDERRLVSPEGGLANVVVVPEGTSTP